jgi:hypothetical protein
MRNIGLVLFFFSSFFDSMAQTAGKVSGTVKDRDTQEPLIGVVVKMGETVQTDQDGKFSLTLPVGKYNLTASYVGYLPYEAYNLNVGSGNALEITVELIQDRKLLKEVVVKANSSARATDMFTPLATQKLNYEEIKVNPGGNFDVSKVIQVLPGVSGGTSANRNDIIVRGGGPSENVYFLDGIEIPVLNHFQTQGASGGATGILNVSFINDVQLSSSAFDARYGNALASTIVVKQRNGNSEKLSGNLRLSGSEFAATLEGPLSKKTTFLASARRSYLQFLFQLLDLPIRPDYWDFQYKVNTKINSKSELTFLGLGAIDNFTLATPKKSDANAAYINRANPLIQQWNYTLGATYKRLINEGYYTVALSRNMFYNGAKRYADNAQKEGPVLYELGSHEAENKLRLEFNKFTEGWKYSFGAEGQYVRYDVNSFSALGVDSSAVSQSEIDFFKAGAFLQAAKNFGPLLVSGGIRTDINSFTRRGPWETFSPRLSLSYALSPRWDISASVGRYYKLPVYTMLAHRDQSLVNRDLKYMRAEHLTAGIQYIPRNDLRFTVEGFYKRYSHYPVAVQSGISFANLGTDFSTVGDEPYQSTGKGRVLGMEAYVQQKLVNKLFYIVSATLFRSEFSGRDLKFRPSTWDYGFTFSSTLGYKFRKNWDLGVKYRWAGGQPYTPFDDAASRANYLYKGTGTYNYELLNESRLPAFSQLDVRVDKKYNFKQVSLSVFVDLQNILGYKTPSLPKYTFERNDDGFVTNDGLPLQMNGANAIPLILGERSATVVPTLGFIFEF